MKKAYTIASIGGLFGVGMIIFGLSMKKNLLSQKIINKGE